MGLCLSLCVHSETLGVATVAAILSSVSAGSVRPSDAVIKVLCKNFKQVSVSGLNDIRV